MSPQRKPDELYEAMTNLKSIIWHEVITPTCEPIVRWLSDRLNRKTNDHARDNGTTTEGDMR